jgi:hypothetical protein
MQTIAFAIPLLPDRARVNRVELASCWVGARREAHQDARRRAGIIREAIWMQPTPARDISVIYLEADDMGAALSVLETSDEPFDRWFREHLRQVHGTTWASALAAPELVLDFDTNRI